jgi:hypothetical protein
MTFAFKSPPPEEVTDRLLDTFRSSPPEVRQQFLAKIARMNVDPEWGALHRALTELHETLGGDI